VEASCFRIRIPHSAFRNFKGGRQKRERPNAADFLISLGALGFALLLMAGMLMIGTIVGILMALFLNNAGGAWDNARKYIETGEFGGKRSEAHRAAVVGDTVGDPFKDTAGPSLHVLIKLLSTITLVLAPLFI
jgi:K(+)-stimulated pyrophosphate-energized sodium pump